MTMALSTGLISGMDTGTLISQLVAAEGAPQAALRARLKATEATSSAYRTVNTTFLAVTAAAESALKPATWSSVKAASSAPSVAVSTSPGATTGALTFTVTSVAAAHSAVSTTRWSSTSTAANLTSIDVKSLDGTTTTGTVVLDGTESLTTAADKINKAGLGITAAIVQTGSSQYALQLTSTKSGAAASFSTGGTQPFTAITAGADATLTVGTTSSYTISSSTNTFEGVLPGATITVSQKETTPVTVSVVPDPDAVAAKISSLVDAVNAAVTTAKTYTSNAKGSTAALKGDFSVSSLAGRLQDAVSFAVGTDGSPARIGFQLNRDGTVKFDRAAFLTALKDTPDLAQRMVAGSPAAGTAAAVPGIAQRLSDVSTAASNSTTGSLVKLADGQDSAVKDIQKRIDAWDLRLAKRKETLTRQFTAMETALSGLRNQSTWLAGQINQLG